MAPAGALMAGGLAGLCRLGSLSMGLPCCLASSQNRGWVLCARPPRQVGESCVTEVALHCPALVTSPHPAGSTALRGEGRRLVSGQLLWLSLEDAICRS